MLAVRVPACQEEMPDRDRLVLEHMPLVKSIAIRVHETLPAHVDLDDLIHAGVIGLLDAAGKYNTDKDVAFSTYAKHRVRGAILDSLRQLDHASRHLRQQQRRTEEAIREMEMALQRTPTEDEVAERLGVEVDRCRKIMVNIKNAGLVSASTRSAGNDELPEPDFPAEPETQPDEIYSLAERQSLLRLAMNTLPQRYQKVVTLYYTNELTMKEIGEMLGINESRVSQIHKAALTKMSAALQSAGIQSSTAL
ncbi:MAG: sigma-70 family RNA polymerase sigma factor [Bryobacteraceae bacterium]